MKCFKTLSVLFFVLLLSSAFTLKDKGQVYIAGVAASFSDSIVYFTDIQTVDSVVLDNHGFLPGRARLSSQLKTYLEDKESLPNRVCLVYFSENRDKLEKQIKKIKEKYIKSKKSYIRELSSESFKFSKPVIEE
jgi:hypothetical protein